MMKAAESNRIAGLAIGRILRLGSRPTQPGDVAEYERCRAIFFETIGHEPRPYYQPNYVRDRNKGAAGD